MTYRITLRQADHLHPATRQGAAEVYGDALAEQLGGQAGVIEAHQRAAEAQTVYKGHRLPDIPTTALDAMTRWRHAMKVAESVALATLEPADAKGIGFIFERD